MDRRDLVGYQRAAQILGEGLDTAGRTSDPSAKKEALIKAKDGAIHVVTSEFMGDSETDHLLDKAENLRRGAERFERTPRKPAAIAEDSSTWCCCFPNIFCGGNNDDD